MISIADGPATPGIPRVEYVGEERAPVVVIDGAINDPERLVDVASRCSYRSVEYNFYPGVRAPAPRGYADRVVSGLERLVGEVFGLSEVTAVQCDFSLVTTRPERLGLQQVMPHFDTTDPNQLAVLHYLCPPQRGGTSFYRHRSTGFESISAERYDPYLAGIATQLEASGPPEQSYINGDTALFERIATVDAVFNRLVIYRSVVLHSGDIARDFTFDLDVRKGRLTANTFIKYRRGPAA